jgi:hypothetical protein
MAFPAATARSLTKTAATSFLTRIMNPGKSYE